MQGFDRPGRGRALFEELSCEKADAGRLDRGQLECERRVTR